MDRIPFDGIPVGSILSFPDTRALWWLVGAALLLVFLVLLWAVRSGTVARRLRCPTEGRMAKVVFLLSGDMPVDVLRCSLLAPGRVTCQRTCLQPGAGRA